MKRARDEAIRRRDIVLIFPHQLFYSPLHPAVDHVVVKSSIETKRVVDVYLVEEHLFFTQYAFHKAKLTLHRASMKCYERFLRQKLHDVTQVSEKTAAVALHYVEATDHRHDIRKLLPSIVQQEEEITFHCVDVVDDWLRRRTVSTALACKTPIVWYDTPNFLTKLRSGVNFFETRSGSRKFFMAPFYEWQRVNSGILLNTDKSPVGGKWSLDDDNRKKMPKGCEIPCLPPVEKSLEACQVHMKEAIEYVESMFPQNYGSTQFLKASLDKSAICPFAIDRSGALACLSHFLDNRFLKFGDFQDAMVRDQTFLSHSMLAFMINVGLLLPSEVVNAAVKRYSAHEVPLNSCEGFVRQILGWREYVRVIYEVVGRRQRISNFWNFSTRMPQCFWTGNTGIAPVDDVVDRVVATGYAHHIERLMILGNFFLLCELVPNDVYRWFMEMFVDSLDWVMVPNVYGMSQYSDGGLMCTKPYISGSNYVVKMSDWKSDTPVRFPKSKVSTPLQTALMKFTWAQVWDALFWSFIDKHRDVISRCHRLGMLISTFDKFPLEKRASFKQVAAVYKSYLLE